MCPVIAIYQNQSETRTDVRLETRTETRELRLENRIEPRDTYLQTQTAFVNILYMNQIHYYTLFWIYFNSINCGNTLIIPHLLFYIEYYVSSVINAKRTGKRMVSYGALAAVMVDGPSLLPHVASIILSCYVSCLCVLY